MKLRMDKRHKRQTCATAAMAGLLYILGAVCAGAQGVNLIPALPLAFDPAPPGQPQKVITPRTETKLLTFGTKGGRGQITFSFSLPPNVPSSALEFVIPTASGGLGAPGSPALTPVPGPASKFHPDSLPAQPAFKTLKFKGCETGCPDTFTITLTAKDSNNASVSQNVQFVLTRAKIRPVIRSISEISSPVGPVFASRFYRIDVEPDTYFSQDQGSEVIAIYTQNFRYSLGNGLSPVRVPRLGSERNLQIIVKNPYGESRPVGITLSPDLNESFPSVPPKSKLLGDNVVLVPQNGPARFTRSHGLFLPTSGFDSFHVESGALSVGCTNCSNTRGSITTALGCGQVGAVYNGARVTVVSVFGIASVHDEPPRGELLGTGQLINVSWDRGQADIDYEMVFSIFFVEGVCPPNVR